MSEADKASGGAAAMSASSDVAAAQTDPSSDFSSSGEQSSEGHLAAHHGRVRTARSDSSCCPSKVSKDIIGSSLLAALGGMFFGYDAGIISGALLQLKSTFDLSCQESEFVVSSLLLGALIASICAGVLIDFLGRRLTIIITAVVFLVGSVLLAASVSYTMLLVGRFVLGFAVSVSAIAECVYISEISPPTRRGLLVSLYEFGITLGFLVAYLVGYCFVNVDNGWRFMFGFVILPAAVQGVSMFFLPMSPRYLMIKGREFQARLSLQRLRGTSEVETELTDIRTALVEERSFGCQHLFTTKNNMAGRMFVGIGLVFLQQVTGQPNVLYYAPLIFNSIGFKTNAGSTFATLLLGIVKVLFTGVTLVFIDKAGRRKFLMAGATLMFISITTLGIVTKVWQDQFGVTDPCSDVIKNTTNINNTLGIGHADTYSYRFSNFTAEGMDQSGLVMDAIVSEKTTRSPFHQTFGEPLKWPSNSSGPQPQSEAASMNPTAKWIAVLSLMFYVAGYAIGFGPGTWLVLSEIFPSSIKGRAMSVATIFNWGVNLVISATFLDTMGAIGVSTTFLVYGVVCALSVIFIYAFVPETKGRSLEQITAELSQGSLKAQLGQKCCGCLPEADNRSVQPQARYRRMDVEMDASD